VLGQQAFLFPAQAPCSPCRCVADTRAGTSSAWKRVPAWSGGRMGMPAVVMHGNQASWMCTWVWRSCDGLDAEACIALHSFLFPCRRSLDLARSPAGAGRSLARWRGTRCVSCVLAVPSLLNMIANAVFSSLFPFGGGRTTHARAGASRTCIHKK